MYGEFMIGLNMMFNFTILSFANNMQRQHIRLWRLLLASFVGAIMIVMLSSNITTLMIVFLSMTIIAYGTHFLTWRKLAMTFLFGAIFAGGLLTVIQQKLFHFQRYSLIIVACAFLYIVLDIIKRKVSDVKTMTHTASFTQTSILSLWQQRIPLLVFIDAGNQCEEPLSGKPVHFISYNAMEEYMPSPLRQLFIQWEDLQDPFAVTIPDLYKAQLRLIKVYTIQGEKWVMGLQYSDWTIDSGQKLEDGYIVFTMDQQHFPNGADAILHVSAMQSLS